MAGTRDRIRVIAGGVVLTAAVHVALPAGPHSWHWLHLLAQKLYYVPILMTASWFGLRATLGTTLAVSLFFGVHVLEDWAGHPMVQADQLAEIANFWLVAIVAGLLFARERRALEQVRFAHGETLTALASSLELREPYTAGHSRRVHDYALLLADAMGLTEESLRSTVAVGALLHDVGKIGIPDRILLKEGPLGEEEWREMRRHPDLGAALIGDIRFLEAARELVRAHHERYDGSGYPRGLAGEAIPLGARIFAVADAFDALTTKRPYHCALDPTEASRQIAAGRGAQFDPAVVDAFLRVPREAWSRVTSADGVAISGARGQAGRERFSGGSSF